MQNCGSLKKRRRRNLNKVTGLGTIPYDNELDTYDGSDLFQSSINHFINPKQKNKTITKAEGYASLKIPNILPSRMSSGKKVRVTRDPTFHENNSGNEKNVVESQVQEFSIPIDLSKVRRESLQNFPSERANLSTIEEKYKCFPISSKTIKYLRLIILTGASSFCVPWIWNKKTNRIDLWKNEWFKKIQRLILIFFTIQSFFILLYQLNLVYTNFMATYKTSSRVTFMLMFFILWYGMSVLNNINILLYGESSRIFINGLLDLNQEYTARFVVDKTQHKEAKLVLFSWVVPELWFHIPNQVLQFVSKPTQIFYLYHYIYPMEWADSGWIMRIPFILHECIFAAQVMCGDLLPLWTLFAHTTTTDFWITESHKNNDTGQTTDELRDPRIAVEVYKTLALLNEYFNDCMATVGLLICKTLGCFGLIFCAYIIMRTTTEDFVREFPMIIGFYIGVFSCSSLSIIVLHLSAKVYDLGFGFLDSWGKTKQMDLRRVLLSCQSLRIWMGHFYYISVSTTITFFQVVIGYLIDTIITLP